MDTNIKKEKIAINYICVVLVIFIKAEGGSCCVPAVDLSDSNDVTKREIYRLTLRKNVI